MTNIRLIFRSKWMVAGVVCEILAFIAAVGNWFAGSWPVWQLLPNVALTLATLGAVMVAGRVAWDYHGRGLNERQRKDVLDILASAILSERQREDVQGILASVSLNATQMEEVTPAIKLSGLTDPQKSELTAVLMEIYVVDIVFAQKAVADAIDHLRKPGHGHVVVINRIGFSQYDVQYLDPPWVDVGCDRSHAYESGSDIGFFDIVRSLFQLLGTPLVLWKLPGNGKWNYTNRNDPKSFDGRLVFNLYNCVPEWRAPAIGDYVLTRSDSGTHTWEQRV